MKAGDGMNHPGREVPEAVTAAAGAAAYVPVVALRWRNWRVATAAVYLGGAALLPLMREERALLPWLLFGLLGYLAVRAVTRRDSGLRETYLAAYGLVSFCGWLIFCDNVFNFGVGFGAFSDDGEYYYHMVRVLNGDRWHGIGIYELLLAAIGGGWRLTGMKTVPLSFLLPFNFVLTAWTVLLAGRLARVVTEKAIPLFLLLACTVGNFYFIESLTRLYRDGIVMVLMLTAFCCMAARQPWRGTAAAVAAGVFRGANGIVALLFGGVYAFRRWIGSNAHFWMLAAAGLVTAVVLLRLIPFCLFVVAGDQTRTGTYFNQLERHNTITQLLNRRKALARYFPPGSMARKAYRIGGLTGNAMLLGGTVFYPLTLRGASDSMRVANRYIPDRYLTGGYFRYQWLKWGFTACWLLVAPLLTVGVAAACRKSGLSASLALIYLLLVVGVTLVSMQQRHVCAFVVLHPALAAFGLELSENDRMMIKMRKWLFIIVPIGIILWNIMRYMWLK